MRIGVLAHRSHPRMREILEMVERAAGELEVELAYDARSRSLGNGRAPPLEDAWDSLDFLLTLGGDGTLLQGARQAGPRGVPVLGCNLGRLGFLTAGPLEELEDGLGRLARGDYLEEERLALRIRRVSEDGEHGGRDSFYALNDAVVHKSGFARIITLRVYVDGDEVGQYSADGIVVATATGSTAYSLSAGGPVLVPDLDALVATPISPHMLAVRPVVVPASARITVEVITHTEDTVLTVDGQVGSQLRTGDRVAAARADHPVRLVRFPGRSFFSVLRQKLRWGDVRPRDGD